MIARSVLIFVVAISLGATAGGDDARSSKAVTAGLAYLASQQDSDGSFESSDHKLQTTGLSLIAFLSTGNTSDGGRYATNVRRATEFLIRQASSDDTFGRTDDSGADGQAIVTLALCEAYGVEPDESTRATLFSMIKGAVTVLVATKSDGDWRAAAMQAAHRVGVTTHEAPATSPTAATRPVTQTDLHELSDPARGALLDQQLADGSWPSAGAPDSSTRVAETSRAMILLSRRLELMPLQSP